MNTIEVFELTEPLIILEEYVRIPRTRLWHKTARHQMRTACGRYLHESGVIDAVRRATSIPSPACTHCKTIENDEHKKEL